MRRFGLAMSGMLLTITAVLAQQPLQPPPQPPADPKLEEVLSQWEKVMTGVDSLAAECVRTTNDKTFQTKQTYEGVARYLKTGGRASLEMYKKGEPAVFEKYVCSGTFLYEFAPSAKVIRVHELPQNKTGIADDNFLSFLFGMKSAEAKARYHIMYVPPAPDDKTAGYYHYLRILAKTDADKADFKEARLTLTASTFLPRQLWFQQPNGSEVIWDFPKVVDKAQHRPSDFAQPPLPSGWQFQRVPRETQARIIRQNN